MAQEEIEGNKLIAEFDGLTISKSGKTYRKKNGSPFKSNDCKYHSSFDWTIPVVRKIFKTQWIDKNSLPRLSLIKGAMCNCDIQELFKAVVEFLKWYNKQEK